MRASIGRSIRCVLTRCIVVIEMPTPTVDVREIELKTQRESLEAMMSAIKRKHTDVCKLELEHLRFVKQKRAADAARAREQDRNRGTNPAATKPTNEAEIVALLS